MWSDLERILHARLGVAHPHLQRVEERMQPDVPPDFLGVVDATGLNQQLAAILIFRERLERMLYAGAGKTFEYFQAITFQPRVLTHPEGGVDGQCVYVRQKVARL